MVWETTNKLVAIVTKLKEKSGRNKRLVVRLQNRYLVIYSSMIFLQGLAKINIFLVLAIRTLRGRISCPIRGEFAKIPIEQAARHVLDRSGCLRGGSPGLLCFFN